MSSYNAGPCGICGAVTDYCHLTTASGIEIDCRDLKLANPADLDANIELARELFPVSKQGTEPLQTGD